MQQKFPGMLEDETAGDWALRAEVAREDLRAMVKSGIRLNPANSRLELLDPQLVEGKNAKIKCIEPFIGSGKSLRELSSHWGLIAVLARDELWPGRLPTDKVAREACPVAVNERSITRWRCDKWDQLDKDIKAATQAAGDEVNSFFDSSFDDALSLTLALSPTGGSGSNSPPGIGGAGGNGSSGGSDSGGSASSANTPSASASASGGDDSDGSPAAAEALEEGVLVEGILEGGLPMLEEAVSDAPDPPGTSDESRAHESPAASPRPTPQRSQAVHALPRTEDLEAPGLLEASGLLETAEVCQLIEQEAESPHSPDATPTGGGARSAGSPPLSSSAAALGATPASAPAASAPAASAPAAPTAVEPAAAPEPDVSCQCVVCCTHDGTHDVSCQCGLPCVRFTSGRMVRRTFLRCPRDVREGGCMFYRRCDRTASYDGPGCVRADCVCTASFNGEEDEYCCQTCRDGRPCSVPKFEHAPWGCYHPEPWPEYINATRKGSRQTESGPRKGRRQDDADDW